jgi:hypothetical protein
VRAPHGDFARCKRNFHVTCALVNKGRRLSASDLEVRRIMGEGSYGQVFEASIFSRGRKMLYNSNRVVYRDFWSFRLFAGQNMAAVESP